MENTPILNYSELLARLTELKSERGTHEASLKYSFNEFINNINFVSFFKSAKNSNSLQSNDLMKSSLNEGINLLTGLVLGKNRSIKGYLSTLMVERFTTMIIDNKLINIIPAIGSLLFRKKRISIK